MKNYTNEQAMRIFRILRKHSDKQKRNWTAKEIWASIRYWDRVGCK